MAGVELVLHSAKVDDLLVGYESCELQPRPLCYVQSDTSCTQLGGSGKLWS